MSGGNGNFVEPKPRGMIGIMVDDHGGVSIGVKMDEGFKQFNTDDMLLFLHKALLNVESQVITAIQEAVLMQRLKGAQQGIVQAQAGMPMPPPPQRGG